MILTMDQLTENEMDMQRMLEERQQLDTSVCSCVCGSSSDMSGNLSGDKC